MKTQNITNSISEVIIPAAGLGTRMKSVTKGKCSKLMLKVDGKPLIYHTIKACSNFKKIIVVANREHRDFVKYVKKFPKVIVVETSPSGCGSDICKGVALTKGFYFAVVFPDLYSPNWEQQPLKIMDIHPLHGIIQYVENRGEFGKSSELEMNKFGIIRNFGDKKMCSTYPVAYYLHKNFARWAMYKEDVTMLQMWKKLSLFCPPMLLAEKLDRKFYDLGNPRIYRKLTKTKGL